MIPYGRDPGDERPSNAGPDYPLDDDELENANAG